MELTMLEGGPGLVHAGYQCPCGCTPSVEYARGAAPVEEGCCCGNQFAVGPDASASLAPKAGFRAERQAFDAPWGEALEAAWLVGPSVHGPSDHAGSDEHDHDHDDHGGRVAAIDPVCGMSVDPDTARSRDLVVTHEGKDYFFCGKGCRLEFGDDPGRFLDPSYVPSM